MKSLNRSTHPPAPFYRQVPSSIRLSVRWRPWALCLTMVVGVSFAPADTLKLKNGTVLEGVVLAETDDTVQFKDSSQMVLSLPRNAIEEVVHQANSMAAEDQGDQALENGEYEAAIDHYKAALDAGGEQTRLRQKIAQARQKIEESALGQFLEPIRDAEKLMAEGKLDRADEALEELAEKCKDAPDIFEKVRSLQAHVALERSREFRDSIRYAEANEELLRARKLAPNEPKILIELADLNAQSLRTHGLAIQQYIESLKLAGDDKLTEDELLSIHFKLAELYEKNRRFEMAARHLNYIVDRNPNFRRNLTDKLIRVLTNLASESEINDPQVAIGILREAIRIRPNNVTVQANLARLLFENENYDEAISEFQRLLNLDPRYREANHQLAKAYMAMQDTLSAKIYFEAEVQVNPSNYDAWCDLGEIQWKLDDVDAAQESYRRAKEVNPDRPRALVALASAERRLGNYSASRNAIQDILSKYPTDVRANLEMGMLFLDEKKYNDASKYFNRVLELMKTGSLKTTIEGKSIMADALLGRGAVLLLTTGPGTASKDFNLALEVYPDYPAAHFSIGEAYKKKFSSSKALDDLKEAEKEYLLARKLAPNNPEFALGLGLFYQNVLASEDKENEKTYIQSAIDNYTDYLNNGGSRVGDVTDWIHQLGGDV